MITNCDQCDKGKMKVLGEPLAGELMRCEGQQEFGDVAFTVSLKGG